MKNLFIIISVLFIGMNFISCASKGICSECGKEKSVREAVFFKGTEAEVREEICSDCLKQAREVEKEIMKAYKEMQKSE